MNLLIYVLLFAIFSVEAEPDLTNYSLSTKIQDVLTNVKIQSIWINDNTHDIVEFQFNKSHELSCVKKAKNDEKERTVLLRNSLANHEKIFHVLYNSYLENKEITKVGLELICGRPYPEIRYIYLSNMEQ